MRFSGKNRERNSMEIKFRKITLLSGAFFLILGLVFTIREGVLTIITERSLDKKMHEHAQKEIDKAAEQLRNKFQLYISIAQAVAKEIGTSFPQQTTIEKITKKTVELNGDFCGACAAFEPYALDASKKLFSFAYMRKDGGITPISLAYDYTISTTQAHERTDWYTNFIRSQAGWTEPYFAATIHDHVIGYSTPLFTSGNNNAVGVLEIDILLDSIKTIVNGLVLSDRSYGRLISSRGTAVANQYEKSDRKSTPLVDAHQAQDLLLFSHIRRGVTRGNFSFTNKLSGVASVIYFTVIPDTPFIMQIAFVKDDFFPLLAATVKQHKTKSLYGLLFVLALLFIFLSIASSNRIKFSIVIITVVLCVTTLLIGNKLLHLYAQALPANHYYEALKYYLLFFLALLFLLTLFFLKSLRKCILFAIETCIALGIIFILLKIYDRSSTTKSLRKEMHHYATQQLDSAAQKINNQLQKYVDLTQNAAREFESRSWDAPALQQFVTAKAKAIVPTSAVSLAFEPYTFDKSMRLCFPLYRVKNNAYSIVPTYDYRLPSSQAHAFTDWYRDRIVGQAGWSEPYLDVDYKEMIISYGTPIIYGQKSTKKPNGVLTIDVGLDDLRMIIKSLSLGKQSYGFLVSKRGKFIAHPVEDLYRKEKNIFDVAKELKNKQLETFGYEIQRKNFGFLPYKDPLSGQSSILFYRALPGIDCVLGIVFIQDELFLTQKTLLKRDKIAIALALIFILLLLIIFYVIHAHNLVRALVTGAVLSSFLLIAGIAYFWFIQQTESVTLSGADIPIFDEHMLQKILPRRNIAQKEGQLNDQAYIFIKTGIVIDHLEQIFNTRIALSGKIWQRYPLSTKQFIDRDFIIPQNKIGFQKKLILQQKNGNEELYIWRFTGDIAQEKLIERPFPFDRQSASLTIDHPSLCGHVVLVPDFDGYPTLAPQALPGLECGNSLTDWSLEKAFFSISPYDQAVRMETMQSQSTCKKYALIYHIQASRYLFSLLIMYLLPLLVSLLMFFFNLCMMRRNYIMIALSIMSGNFLSLIFAHSALRNAVPGAQVLYLEFFYIVAYVLVVLLAINLLLFSQPKRVPLIEYQDNLIAKVIFLPTFLIIMLIITSYFFW